MPRDSSLWKFAGWIITMDFPTWNSAYEKHETDVSATKIYNGRADKMARTRANVASSLQKNTRSFSFRVARELDLSGIIKRIEGKRKRKKEAYLFTKWRGIPLATAKNPKRPPREVRRFSFLSTFAFSSLLFTAEPNGSNENAVERARFVESFTLSWLRTRPE